MDEETNNETIQEEQTETVVTKANEAAERLEKATAQMEAALKRQEALKVESMLGGKTEKSEPPKEISAAEYAKKALAGESNE